MLCATFRAVPFTNIKSHFCMVKPQLLQRLEEGKYWSIATMLRPPHSPLYWSWRTSSLQPASAIALDSFGLRIAFFTLRDLTQTTWFSLISLRDNLCRLSIRQSTILAWRRATFKRALARFFEPFVSCSICAVTLLIASRI